MTPPSPREAQRTLSPNIAIHRCCILFSQVLPQNFFSHLHSYFSPSRLHWPKFLHGLLWQGSLTHSVSLVAVHSFLAKCPFEQDVHSTRIRMDVSENSEQMRG